MPNDPRDESPLRSTKDDLLKHIEQVDREIAKVSRAEQSQLTKNILIKKSKHVNKDKTSLYIIQKRQLNNVEYPESNN